MPPVLKLDHTPFPKRSTDPDAPNRVTTCTMFPSTQELVARLILMMGWNGALLSHVFPCILFPMTGELR